MLSQSSLISIVGCTNHTILNRNYIHTPTPDARSLYIASVEAAQSNKVAKPTTSFLSHPKATYTPYPALSFSNTKTQSESGARSDSLECLEEMYICTLQSRRHAYPAGDARATSGSK